MEKKIYPDNAIVLDGRLDEAVWKEVPECTGFTTRKIVGGELVQDQTFVKILPCENRVYFGIKCMESNMDFVRSFASQNIYCGSSVEVFLSPTGSASEVYNFAVTIDGLTQVIYFVEGGNNKAVFTPDWNHAVYMGEDHWSIEIEFPLSAFNYSPIEKWTDEWLVNVIRNQPSATEKGPWGQPKFTCSTWSKIDKSFLEGRNFQRISGMPMRALRNDIKFTGVALDLNEATECGYRGMMEVTMVNPVADTFTFTSDFSESAEISLQAGTNTFAVPCCVPELTNYDLSLKFQRVDDGEVFKYYTPVTAEFEPIRISFTLPEYRTNFYPGQDYSKIVGKVTAPKPVTLKLEGGGVQTQIVTPDKDGNFTFQTADFEEGGEATLTATIDGWEITKTMRRIKPTGRMMSWVSGGRMIVDGKAILRRNLTAAFYKGGEAFDRRYREDDLHETLETRNICFTQPRWLIPGAETFNASSAGEATKDQAPTEEMLAKLDALIEESKAEDFVQNYTADEPEYHHFSLIYMRKYCDYLREKDPYHIIRICTHNPDVYMPYCDWIGTDPYIDVKINEKGERTYRQPINTLRQFLDPVAELKRPDKVVGFVATAFAYKNISLDYDYPTFDEINCHIWVALNHGARALGAYAYHDINDRPRLYEGMRYVFHSVETLEDTLLFGDRKILLSDENIDATIFEHGDKTIFVVVNMSDKPQTATVDGISGSWYHFRNGGMITDNTFSLKPHEVVIGTRTVRDEGLPTYAETVALIDRLEAERMNSKSLLFERTADIKITASKGAGGSRHKLFDGVKDNLGFELKEKDSFIELDLTKVKPTFDKITVGGWHLEDMVIKVCVGEQLVTLEPAEVQAEEFSATFVLNAPVSPDALRFEFPQERVELYEIEVY